MYDVVIIGLGCAGYTSAIYAARYRLKTLIVGEQEGGMGMFAADVGNWPGDIEITGPELMERLNKHALRFDVDHKLAGVDKVTQGDNMFSVALAGGGEITSRAVIFATGSNKRHLGVAGEDELGGKGVTYCATCDAFFYKGKDVAVIGGGDSAVEGAAIAAQVCKTVYLIHRREKLRAEPYWIEKLNERKNVVPVLGYNVASILGEGMVSGVKLDKEFNGNNVIEVAGVFIEIGSDPASMLAAGLGCELDTRNFVVVDDAQRTSVAGVFAAGDVTSASNHFAQFATAAGEGAVAGNSVFTYLQIG